MFACPWYQEAVELLKRNPQIDRRRPPRAQLRMAQLPLGSGARARPECLRSSDSRRLLPPLDAGLPCQQVRSWRGGARARRADGSRDGVRPEDLLRRLPHGHGGVDAAASRGRRADREEVPASASRATMERSRPRCSTRRSGEKKPTSSPTLQGGPHAHEPGVVHVAERTPEMAVLFDRNNAAQNSTSGDPLVANCTARPSSTRCSRRSWPASRKPER